MNKTTKQGSQEELQDEQLPAWLQWVLAAIAMALGGWFGWMMF